MVPVFTYDVEFYKHCNDIRGHGMAMIASGAFCSKHVVEIDLVS